MDAVDRATLVATLRAALQRNPAVDAAWEVGSAAFAALDEWSDVDAVVVVADDAVDAVLADVEAALATLSPVALRLDLPPAPGYRQKFYRLRDAGEFLVVDLVLIRRSDPLLFRELELHGRGQAWLDRRALLAERHIDAQADHAAAAARVPALRDAFEMFQHIPTKERLRGRAVEALHFYQAMTVRPLVEALRLLHCPERRVFSVRYLARDLPAEVCRRVEALSFVRDLDDLAIKHDEARAWFADCIAALERAGPGAAAAAAGQSA